MRACRLVDLFVRVESARGSAAGRVAFLRVRRWQGAGRMSTSKVAPDDVAPDDVAPGDAAPATRPSRRSSIAAMLAKLAKDAGVAQKDIEDAIAKTELPKPATE